MPPVVVVGPSVAVSVVGALVVSSDVLVSAVVAAAVVVESPPAPVLVFPVGSTLSVRLAPVVVPAPSVVEPVPSVVEPSPPQEDARSERQRKGMNPRSKDIPWF